MSNSAIDFLANASESALEKLQEAVINKKKLTINDIIEALTQDVSNGNLICPVHFTRFVAQNELVTRPDLHVMIKILGNGMTSQLTRDPDVFLSYAKAASICARKL